MKRIKVLLFGVSGGFGYMLLVALLSILTLAPLYVFDWPFLVSTLAFGLAIIFNRIYTLISPTLWVWALVEVIKGPQDWFATVYYVLFVVWLLFFVLKISSFISMLRNDDFDDVVMHRERSESIQADVHDFWDKNNDFEEEISESEPEFDINFDNEKPDEKQFVQEIQIASNKNIKPEWLLAYGDNEPINEPPVSTKENPETIQDTPAPAPGSEAIEKKNAKAEAISKQVKYIIMDIDNKVDIKIFSDRVAMPVWKRCNDLDGIQKAFEKSGLTIEKFAFQSLIFEIDSVLSTTDDYFLAKQLVPVKQMLETNYKNQQHKK